MASKTKSAKALTVGSTAPSKITYKDMIKSAIIALKERNGSSRQGLKKYVQSNYDIKASNFDSLFNTALRKGVESGDFLQPKGPSGPVKLSKKEKLSTPVVAKVTKPAPKKAAVTKKATSATVKKAAPKKPAATKKESTKKTAPKKVTKKAPAANKATAAKKTSAKKATAKKAATKKTTKK